MKVVIAEDNPIAQRLLAAGRSQEAWQTIQATEHRRSGWPDFEWEDARVDVLDALGRGDEAQAARWSCLKSSSRPVASSVLFFRLGLQTAQLFG